MGWDEIGSERPLRVEPPVRPLARLLAGPSHEDYQIEKAADTRAEGRVGAEQRRLHRTMRELGVPSPGATSSTFPRGKSSLTGESVNGAQLDSFLLVSNVMKAFHFTSLTVSYNVGG